MWLGEAQERGLVSKETFLRINGGHSLVIEVVFLPFQALPPWHWGQWLRMATPPLGSPGRLSLEEAGGTGLVFSS